MTDWRTDLPALLAPEHQRFRLEATSVEAKAFMMDLRARTMAARADAQALADRHGGKGFWAPFDPSQQPTATLFAFERPPTDKAWKVNKKRVADAHYSAGAAKTPEGKVLAAEMKACTPFPDTDREMAAALNLLTTIKHATSGQGWGFSSVGSFQLVSPAWTEERLFAVCANPFYTLRSTIESNPEATITAQNYVGDYEGDPRLWRPPEGWTLRSEAELELIFAQARVDAERAKAA
jgi:hypothetical protein